VLWILLLDLSSECLNSNILQFTSVAEMQRVQEEESAAAIFAANELLRSSLVQGFYFQDAYMAIVDEEAIIFHGHTRLS
jgi:hypothetical protein